ncbi:homoserine dehydrogenase [Butyrivibrio hungatei DSM 14810]|uniref:Homoserine dehydrogenase n=1 Tax=Butyrivibrio hungatei DSM 14810 TaxID=1121132 RepID=A0A1M7RWK6_9FIRM|nr:homoserine dehydrogenase [Butyrivibrio hungatei]SHN50566.1 homoserine dehydrogenase [Butyrivibrio hungatei DSM 14810]
MAKVAVLGYGTVGSGVVEVLDTNAAEVEKSAGEKIELKYILDLRDFPGDKHESQVVHDINVILDDPEVDVICETMGGIEPAFTFEKQALSKGKSVCTSNKELVAAHGPELVELAKANGVSYLFEASVGGGIPVLRSLNDSLKHEKIDSITGILNGTTNYILTKMDKEGIGFETVLKQAQEKGYAERNPEADVEGYDACRKIAILSSLMSGKHVDYEDIYTEGISKINIQDFEYARSLNMAIKLLAMCKRNENGFFTIVAPFLIPYENPLANVNGVFNAINVHGNMLGDVMFYGKGAGKNATASAVVADVIDMVKHKGKHIEVNMKAEKANLSPKDNAVRHFFVRVSAELEDQAREIFGSNLDVVKRNSIPNEFAFITDSISEKDFEEKLWKMDSVKGYIRLY